MRHTPPLSRVGNDVIGRYTEISLWIEGHPQVTLIPEGKILVDAPNLPQLVFPRVFRFFFLLLPFSMRLRLHVEFYVASRNSGTCFQPALDLLHCTCLYYIYYCWLVVAYIICTSADWLLFLSRTFWQWTAVSRSMTSRMMLSGWISNTLMGSVTSRGMGGSSPTLRGWSIR